jgi:hypothetical protein
MRDIQNGLNKQLQEKNNSRLNTKRTDAFYGRMLKERDQLDIMREQDEINRKKMQQKQLYKNLNTQAQQNNSRHRYEDMMSEQERMMNSKDLEAYQSSPPVQTARHQNSSQYTKVTFTL